MNRDLEWLQDSLHAIDRVWFSDRLQEEGLRITWMRFQRTKKWFRFGCWSPGLIEIHPVLALDWVPDFVLLRFIFHEALHASFNSIEHEAAFLLAERAFPHFAASEVWTSENHALLIEARPPKGLKRK